MTIIKLNPAFEEFRGKMAGIVYRMRYGKQTGSKAPRGCRVKGQVERRTSGTPQTVSSGGSVCPYGDGG